MDDKLALRGQELKFLSAAYQKSPELFKTETFTDDAKFLENFGILIQGQEKLPLGYIKLWPQDFIVEEVAKNNEVFSVDYANLLKAGATIEDGRTIYATLVKCNASTIEAVESLAQFLECDVKQIQYGGIKDKNAITSQRISFRDVSEIRLTRAASPYYFLKDVQTGKGVIGMGSMKGNKFTILIRTVGDFDKNFFLQQLEKIKAEGFYNFYYLQRFGTPRLINFYWGLAILRGQYKDAISGFLATPGKREVEYFQRFRQELKSYFGDWEKVKSILNQLPLIFENELRVVSYLCRHPEDFSGALAQIPQQVNLWVFALSSILFNKKLSSYIRDNQRLPEKLPLFLSADKNDLQVYQWFLEKLDIDPPPFSNLKPFRGILLRKREIKTKEKAEIYKFEFTKEGIILEFFLPKGVYATTFLIHLFNLVSGSPPAEIVAESIDVKAVLGYQSLTETLNYFKDVISSKAENIFEKVE